ncbi:MAG: hypothetical protein H7235_10705 [Bdellovibrionaceae bacterium]|nr:hypothetical protein [Pseudobdellovibrionaceae bacterium]
MSSELNQYLTFLNQTLGVKSIVFNSAENASTTKNDTIKYFIYVENLSTYSTDESTLLEKMMGALKLDPIEFGLFDLNQNEASNDSQLGLKIILRDQPKEKGETFSPRILLQKPEMKRKAWDDLKLTFNIK